MPTVFISMMPTVDSRRRRVFRTGALVPAPCSVVFEEELLKNALLYLYGEEHPPAAPEAAGGHSPTFISRNHQTTGGRNFTLDPT
jgi:hypothetical protein